MRQVLLLPLAALLVVSAGCRVQQEEAGEAPDVDVNVDPGKLPEYDVDGPEVEVGTEEKDVTVPEVEVTQEEKTINVPDVDVNLPTEDKPQE
ncbi:hypothetical protein IQ257_16260 [Coleofasciculus sp. LEGE 07092]|nr:hypothetical protein [Coleofasciculus sp. LEGE 07081]MBE9150025.1 hypothetical protein [Coleofasciculus sp. LEGE 07092]